MNDSQRYTFGDGELAAARLALLAEAYTPATRAFLEWAGVRGGRTVVDLGCGPGYSTRLLSELLRPEETIGLDNSPLHLGRARRDAPPGVRFVEHDVGRGLLPIPAGSLLFCRFLLAHLAEPVGVLANWARAVGPGGRLLVQETAELRVEVASLQRYYAWVAEMQAHYGQSLYVGRNVEVVAHAAGWHVCAARETVNPIPVPIMARLHAMNLETCRKDSFVAARHSPEELDRLADELGQLSVSQRTDKVESVLGEAVLEYH